MVYLGGGACIHCPANRNELVILANALMFNSSVLVLLLFQSMLNYIND